MINKTTIRRTRSIPWGPAAAAFGALAALSAAGGAVAQEAVDLEFVLAADGSGSISDEEFWLQREGYAAAITSPDVLSAIQSGQHQRIALAYVEWGGPDSQHIVVRWMVVGDAASALAFAEELLRQPRTAFGHDSISGAIDYAAGLITDNDWDGLRKVIDISGDGPQIGDRPVKSARDDAVAAGITINALVIETPDGGHSGPGGMPLGEHYQRDVVGGAGAFVMTVEGRAGFRDAITRKLVLEIADRAAHPDGAHRLATGSAFVPTK